MIFFSDYLISNQLPADVHHRDITLDFISLKKIKLDIFPHLFVLDLSCLVL